MRRRDILTGAGSLAAGAAASFPAPAIAQGIRQLKMVTDWPEDTPGLQTGAVRFAQTVSAATGGRIKIEVFPAGALVRPFETFDAVGAGVADMYHSIDYYFEQKSPAFNFFSTVPFGFTADELFAWVQFGGGQELWDALSGQFNIKPLLCGNSGCQMGGWFTREITSPEGFKGLRYRMAGLGAEVLRRLGAIVVTLPGGEIVPALKSGAIDASEWADPWLDMAMGLHKVARFYYYPGFTSPAPASPRDQQGRVGKLRRRRPAGLRGSGRGRIRALLGRVQRQQRALAAQAAGRRYRQDPEVRRLRAEGLFRDQQGCSRRGRRRRRAFQENLRKLPAVPHVDHGLERHRGARLPQQPQARMISAACIHAIRRAD
jgi:TRAP-type C4-dicarboxylate transport system substrate-binding protein